MEKDHKEGGLYPKTRRGVNARLGPREVVRQRVDPARKSRGVFTEGGKRQQC